MKLNIISSVLLIGALVTVPTSVQARSINHLVSKSTLAEYCENRQAGAEFSVQLTKSDGTIIRGNIECDEDNGMNSDRISDNDDSDNDDNDRDDEERNDERDDDRDDNDDDRDDGDDRDDDDQDDDNDNDTDND